MANIEHGDRGAAVLLLQGVLAKLGYEITNADGIFGGETYDAVQSFQEYNGLDIDGVVGNETAQAIVSAVWELGDAEYGGDEDYSFEGDEVASSEYDENFSLDEDVDYDNV